MQHDCGIITEHGSVHETGTTGHNTWCETEVEYNEYIMVALEPHQVSHKQEHSPWNITPSLFNNKVGKKSLKQRSPCWEL